MEDRVYEANRLVYAWIMLVGLQVSSERAERSGAYKQMMGIGGNCFSVTLANSVVQYTPQDRFS